MTLVLYYLLDRTLVHFVQAGDAGLDLREPRAAQVPHPLGCGLVRDVDGVALLQDDPLDLFRYRHDLVQARAALVAVRALAAAHRFVRLDARRDLLGAEAFLQQRLGRHVDRRLAGVAELARQPLRDDQRHGSGDRVWLDA